jgi:prepilin-type processing-associated H-X9-DG protein
MKKVVTIAVVLFMVVFCLLFFVIPNIHWMSPEGERVSCMSNLSQIGKALELYAAAHDQSAPPTLQELAKTLQVTRLFVCKASGHQAGPLAEVADWTDYTYLSQAGSNMVQAFCPPENHKDTGGNILFADGSVHWYNTNQFAIVMKHGRDALTNN